MTIDERDDPQASDVAAAQAGDEHAFGRLWRDVNPRVLRYLRTLAPDVADDIAAEAWLQVVRKLASFRGDDDDFRRWVFTIARNKLTDAHRQAARRPAVAESGRSGEPPVLDRPAPDDTAAAALESLDTDAALRLIASLPRDQAEVVLLRAVAGLDVAAVARVVGKSPGAVRVSAHRGLSRLRELLPYPALLP